MADNEGTLDLPSVSTPAAPSGGAKVFANSADSDKPYAITPSGTFELSAGSLPLTTKGDLLTYDTGNARLGVGTNGQVPFADSAQPAGIRWGDAPEITTGAGSPAAAPAAIGDKYIDTTNGRVFEGVDTSANTDFKRSDSGVVLIASSDIVADAASVTLSSLVLDNNEFNSFELVVSGLETDRATITDQVLMAFNADTTAANYDSIAFVDNGTTVTRADVVGTLSGVQLFRVAAGTSADSGMFGAVKVTIFNPLSTADYKLVEYRCAQSHSTTGEGNNGIGTGVWESTAAITSITLTPVNGTTFLVGGAGEPQALTVRLYGLY